MTPPIATPRIGEPLAFWVSATRWLNGVLWGRWQRSNRRRRSRSRPCDSAGERVTTLPAAHTSGVPCMTRLGPIVFLGGADVAPRAHGDVTGE